MKKNFYILVTLLLLGSTARSQQIPQYSQYLWNNYLINPAIAGSDNHFEMKAGYRDQWVGMEGAPRTLFFTIQGQIGKKMVNREDIDVVQRNINHRPYRGLKKSLGITPRKFPKIPQKYVLKPHHGIGMQVLNDRIGPFNTTALFLTYAYHIPITKTLTASMGANLGFKQYRLDLSQLMFGDNIADDLATAGKNSLGATPDASLGVLLYSEKFYIGIATDQVISNKINFANGSKYLNGKLQRHYFVNGAYRIKMTSDLAFVPSAMLRVYPNTPISGDVTMKINYMDVFWFGSSWRYKDAVIGLVGVNLNKQWDIGYSYDVTTSALSRFSKGTHEIVVGYRLINKKMTGCKPSFAW